MAAVRELRSLVRKFSIDFLWLSETKILNVSIPLQRAGFYNFIDFPPDGHQGGMVFAWKPRVDVEFISSTPSSISLLVYSDPPNTPWLISCVYGPTRWHLRDSFWRSLDVLANSFGGPWLCMGDFNCLLADLGKQGGLSFASSSSNPLQNLINDHGLIDLGFSGSPFTWSNNRDGLALIRERLDRGLGNCQWRTLFPRAIITHLGRAASDHSPLLLDTAGGAPPLKKLFCFEVFWLKDPGCEDVVRNCWNVASAGSPAY